jgi:hypothetical protein
MGHSSDLSIFQLQRETRGGDDPAIPAVKPQAAANDREPEPMLPLDMRGDGMLLDLTNLTPETLDAFFPSEHRTLK